jgi:hypothetical protein
MKRRFCSVSFVKRWRGWKGIGSLASEVTMASGTAAGLLVDGMDAILGVHIGTANSLFISRLERQLDALKVTPKQVAILWLTNANPGVKQSDLSRFFQIERPTVHQFVRQLTKNGYVVNEPSKLDRRAGGCGSPRMVSGCWNKRARSLPRTNGN